MQREGLGTCKGSELYFETNKQLSRKVFNGFRPWPGPACRSRRRRRGRGVSDGGQPPVGGRFCQPDRSPFCRLTPAFALRSLWKNGYVLS